MKYLPRKKTDNITPGFRLEVTGGYCSHLKLDITSDKYKLSDVIVGAKSTTQYTKTL